MFACLGLRSSLCLARRAGAFLRSRLLRAWHHLSYDLPCDTISLIIEQIHGSSIIVLLVRASLKVIMIPFLSVCMVTGAMRSRAGKPADHIYYARFGLELEAGIFKAR